MNFLQFLETCESRSIRFKLDGDQIKVSAPDGTLNADFVETLKSFKPELLNWLARAGGKSTAIGARRLDGEIARVERNSAIRASLGQENLWLTETLHDSGDAYHFVTEIELKGKLDVGALERTFVEMLKRHEVLRTYFYTVGDEVFQNIVTLAEFELPIVAGSLRDDAIVDETMRLFANEKFDLTREFPLKARLLRCAPDHYRLLLVLHHIASDGWSLGLLVRDICECYSAFLKGESPTMQAEALQYADFAAWQRKNCAPERLDSDIRYWYDKLTEAPEVHQFPLERPRRETPSLEMGREELSLQGEIVDDLRQLARRSGHTLFVILEGLFAVLVARYSGNVAPVIVSPVANRGREEFESIVGYFANLVPLYHKFDPATPVSSYLNMVGEDIREALGLQHVPYELVVGQLARDRARNRLPVSQISFAFQNNAIPELLLPGLVCNIQRPRKTRSLFDLQLEVSEVGDSLAISLDYATDLFDSVTMIDLLASYRSLIVAAIENPQTPVGDLVLLDDLRQTTLLESLTGPQISHPVDRCIHHLFESQARLTPRAVAVAIGAVQIDYQALNARANQLARYLQAHSLVAPNQPVGLMFERSIDLIVAMLAVMKSGAAYLPIDPGYPGERIAYLINDSGMTALLGASALQRSELNGVVTLVKLDEPATAAEIAACVDVDLDASETDVDSQHLAYVVYTSGSTGAPNGVMITHRNVVNLIGWHIRTFALATEMCASSTAGVAFDAFGWEVWPGLCAGVTLLLEPGLIKRDAREFLDWWNGQPLAVGFLVTPMAEFMFTERSSHPTLANLLIGGDRLHNLPDPWPSFALINNYGPTETTVVATAGALRKEDGSVHIGRPIDNYRVYVLDPDRRIVPRGVVGELYIAGAGVGRGYLNRPTLTREKFLPDPYSTEADAVMYKTGDLVRLRSDGNIEYVGRIDHQIKIRGYRVELGEIEAALAAIEQVREAIVVVARKGTADAKLIGYVVLAMPSGEEGDAPLAMRSIREQIRSTLAQRLPQHMVPARFVIVDALPRNANGKIDRAALREPMEEEIDEPVQTMQTEVECKLLEIWREILGDRSISGDDNFFLVGGHSLSATRIIAKVNQGFGTNLSIKTIFDEPTPRRLASAIERSIELGACPPILPAMAGSALPLSYAQHRLWMLDRMVGSSSQYNMPGMIRLRGRLNRSAVRTAFTQIMQRHHSLRTTINDNGALQPTQMVQELTSFPLNVVDLSKRDDSDREMAAKEFARTEAIHPFNLANDLMMRAHLLVMGEDDHILLVTAHHIAADGWSMAILFKEFSVYYAAALHGEELILPQLPVQYGDYAIWQRSWLGEERLAMLLQYWAEELKDIPTAHNLPLDRPRPPSQTFHGATLASRLDARDVVQLGELCTRMGASIFMGLHAAFSTLLARYSEDTDIVIGSPIANREQSEIADLIGFFVNVLVLRLDLSGYPNFLALLAQSKRKLLGAYAHQQVPFDKIVEKLHLDRSISHSPVFQIMLVYQNNSQATLELPGVEAGAVAQTGNVAKYDLALTVNDEADGGMSLEWEYNTDLFDGATISVMASHFANLLKCMLKDPARPVAEIDFLADDERHKLLVEWNPHHAPFAADLCLHRLFERHAEAMPEQIALVDGSSQITYGKLNEKANQLAQLLRGHDGADPDRVVAVCVPDLIEMTACWLAALKAGCAYMPLDHQYPASRLSFMVADAGAQVVLTVSHLANLFLDNVTDTICLDDPATLSDLASFGKDDPLAASVTTDERDLAYVIYTSGSTGVPKGVQIEHRSIVNFVQNDRHAYGLDASTRMLNPLSIGFDAGGGYLWAALSAGACLHFHAPDSRLFDYIEENGISHAVMPAALLAVQGLRPVDTLKVLISGGDTPNAKALAALGANTKVYNVYGPTETTVTATSELLTEGRQIGIGMPIANAECHVLSGKRILMPIGCVGELYVGGIGVARGYRGQPGLTDERFIDNPFCKESRKAGYARLYRTGDMVRRLRDGRLQFVGRMDGQIKLRGFRIEIAEIELSLSSHPDVEEAVVVVSDTRDTDRQLVAFVVPTEAVRSQAQGLGATGEGELRRAIIQFAQASLPAHMVPRSLIVVDRIPVGATGKIDRNALRELSKQTVQATGRKLPGSEIEERLCEIWKKLLRVDAVALDVNFFDAGGSSLTAIQMQGEIGRQFNLEIAVQDVFSHSTILDLAHFITSRLSNKKPGADILRQARRTAAPPSTQDIAIVGYSGRFPGAGNVAEFWELIANGKEIIQEFDIETLARAGVAQDLLDHPQYVRKGVVLEGIDKFDAEYFGFTPREAEMLCPQQRILLECSTAALEHAGYGGRISGSRVGTFVGTSNSLYLYRHLLPNTELQRSLGLPSLLLAADKDFVATRIAYKLNLEGPAVNINTACSTSLVAVAQACSSLLEGRCEIALAGAASLQALGPEGYLHQEGGILSEDGHCRPFDQAATGSRAGSGAGIVVLKLLDRAIADGDSIHAVIKGIGMNNDGDAKMGFTAPSIKGQTSAIAEALDRSGLRAADIQYIETHGTGTVLGDPIEFAGLQAVYASNESTSSEKNSIRLGAVKANIGHLDAAAGIAGLLKVVLAMQHKKFPPQPMFEQMNSNISTGDDRLLIQTECEDWDADTSPRRSGLSSFGIGGTNVHLIVEEGKTVPVGISNRAQRLLVLSAKSVDSLLSNCTNMVKHLTPHTDLVNAEYTLQVGRAHHALRYFAIADNVKDVASRLSDTQTILDNIVESKGQKKIAFMFPGQGAQFMGMTKELYESEATYRYHLDDCANRLKTHLQIDIREVLFATADVAENAESIRQTALAQPLLFAIEYSLARMWMSWGVQPSIMIGHSLGEYVAACISGVFDLDAALELVVARGRLMQSAPPGAMLSILSDQAQIANLLESFEYDIAAINGETSCVIAGSVSGIDRIQTCLSERGVTCARVQTSHAFHSRFMDGILADYRKVLDCMEFGVVGLPFVSNLDGNLFNTGDRIDAEYWVSHLRHAVYFSSGISTMLDNQVDVLLEVGPGRTLSALVNRQFGDKIMALTSTAGQRDTRSDQQTMLQSLGRIWQMGVDIDWHAFHSAASCHRIGLPSYAFKRESHWIEASRFEAVAQKGDAINVRGTAAPAPSQQVFVAADGEHEMLTNIEVELIVIWRELLGIEKIGKRESFFDLGGDSLLATHLMNKIRERFGINKVDYSLKDLFERPYVETIADAIAREMERQKLSTVIESLADVGEDTEEGII